MKINVQSSDLASKSSKEYPVLPKGTYATTIYDVELTQVKSDGENYGKDQYKVLLKISDGEYAGRTLYTYIPLYTGKSFWKTEAFFTALGYEVAAGTFEVPEPKDLLGKPIGAKVTVVANRTSGDDENNVGGFTAATNGDVDAVLKSMGAAPVDGSVW